MPFDFRQAVRTNSKLLIGLYGQSGSGKTYSSLLLARGLAGDGKIAMIDTESGRGELYADVIPGGYQVVQLSAPFTPTRYIEAIDAAEKAGADVLIIDSGSHEWEGIGGVIYMAGVIEQRTGKPGLHCWAEPKLQHQRFVLKLIQSPLHIIVCLRAKYKSRQIKNARGKSEIIKDDHTTPIQAEDFIFEATAHAEILANHHIRLTKCSHPQMRNCWPSAAPLSIATGQALAEWCKGGSEPTHPSKIAPDGRDSGQPAPEHAEQPARREETAVPPASPDDVSRETSVELDDAPNPAADFIEGALAGISLTKSVERIDDFMRANKAHLEALPKSDYEEIRNAAIARRNELKRVL